jgi:osmoprotectant transport system ATP-binding protein
VALDPLIRFELQVDLKEVFQALGKTVVMVTHDIGEAGFFGDEIVLLKSGRIVQKGTLIDLVQTPAEPFVSRFINAQRSPLESLTEEK